VNALGKKLLRDLYRTKSLIIAIGGVITVGIMTLVTMRSAYLNLSNAKDSYYRQCRMADFWIDLKKVPLAEIHQLTQIEGISEVQARIQFSGTVDLEDSVQAINGSIISLPDSRQTILNDIIIRQGHYFSDEKENQVIVNEKFARAYNLYPGQTIEMTVNERKEQLFIIGTAISSEFTYMLGPGAIMPDPKQFGVFYVKNSFAENALGFQGAANQIVGRFSPGLELAPSTLLDRCEARLSEFGVLSTTELKNQASHQFIQSEIDGVGAMSQVLPAIFLVVASLILNVLMTRMARRQRVSIGTLKALGYSDVTIFVHFLQLGMVVGICGGIAGSVLGYFASMGMTVAYRQFYEFPNLQSGIHVVAMLIGMGASLLCAVAGSMIGAYSALKLQPAEAMRPAPPKTGGNVLLERFSWLWTRLSTSWRMALRSIIRNRMRTGIGIFASAMGSGLLISGLMMQSGQTFMVEFQYDKIAHSDFDLIFSKETDVDVINEIRHFPGVDYVEPRLDIACTLVNGPYQQKTAVTGLIHNPQLTIPHSRSGHPVKIPEDGLILGRQLADNLRARAGDKITMIPTRGDKQAVEIVISKISDGYVGIASYAHIKTLSEKIGETLVVNSAQLKVNNSAADIAELHRQLKDIPAIEAILDQEKTESTLRDLLKQVQWIFIVAVIAFAGTIFFGSILNASMVSLAERTQEVATMLALGYSPLQVGGVFLRESMVVNLVGAVIGIPIGVGLCWLTAESMKTDVLRLPVIFHSYLVGVAVVSASVFGLLAHWLVQNRINNFEIVESLKVQE
jgi:putative ABC transport system permease protein